MGSGSKKKREHEEDFIAVPSDSPSPPSSPSPSRLERDRKKQLRKWASDDIQKFMGDFGSSAADRPKWNARTQMFDLKENDIHSPEGSIQVSEKDAGSDILAKRLEVERLANAAGFYPYKGEKNEETTLEKAVVDDWGNKNSRVEMVHEHEHHKQKDKTKKSRKNNSEQEILESNRHQHAPSVLELIDLTMSSPEGNIEVKKRESRREKSEVIVFGVAEKAWKKEQKRTRKERKTAASAARKKKRVANAVARFGTDEDLLAAKQIMLAQKKKLSKLERQSQREAEEAVVETPKKKLKMNHDSSEETLDQPSATSIYSSNPHKRRDRKSTAAELVGYGSEDQKASPTCLTPTSFLTKGFTKQQSLLGTILKSCNVKSPNAPELTYKNVGMATNFYHQESVILPRKFSITSSTTDSSSPSSVGKRGHVATRTPITPLKSTKPKPSETRSRPTPLADDSDSEDGSPAIITRANKPAGDNEREWEDSFSNVVASLKGTSVSKIKALFNEKGDTSGEGEGLSKVVNSVKQAASVEKIRSIFSPGPAAVNGTGKSEGYFLQKDSQYW